MYFLIENLIAFSDATLPLQTSGFAVRSPVVMSMCIECPLACTCSNTTTKVDTTMTFSYLVYRFCKKTYAV